MERFSRSKAYSAQEIVDTIGRGGNRQAYLLRVEGEILAAHVQRATNPEAPERIYVANTPVVLRLAETAFDQKARIPVFIKEPNNQRFNYQGRFEVRDFNRSADAIATAGKLSGREKLAGVLELSHIPTLDGEEISSGDHYWPMWLSELLDSITLATQRIVAGRPDVSDEQLGSFVSHMLTLKGEASTGDLTDEESGEVPNFELLSSLLNVDGEKILKTGKNTVTLNTKLLRKTFDVA